MIERMTPRLKEDSPPPWRRGPHLETGGASHPQPAGGVHFHTRRLDVRAVNQDLTTGDAGLKNGVHRRSGSFGQGETPGHQVQPAGQRSKVEPVLQRSAELESAYYRLNELIDNIGRQREENPGSLTPTREHGCRFDNVLFAHDDIPVIRNVSLDIAVGEITVLQGPSGSGKTTLIDLLTGLHIPDSGDILIDGTPLQQIDLRQWRRMIGYVPQELALLHDTVLLNGTLGD